MPMRMVLDSAGSLELPDDEQPSVATETAATSATAHNVQIVRLNNAGLLFTMFAKTSCFVLPTGNCSHAVFPKKVERGT